MHSLIARVLVFFILFANLAWAADVHEMLAVPQPADILVAGDPASDSGCDQGGHTASCDHCCHGAAHYVGVPPGDIAGFPAAESVRPSIRLSTATSYDLEPPLPPPNI